MMGTRMRKRGRGGKFYLDGCTGFGRIIHIILPNISFMIFIQLIMCVITTMQMLDVPNRCWSEKLLNMLNIDPSLLAKVYESCEVTGHISKAAAELTGLSEDTLVVGGAGDNAAAAVGTGVVEDGRAFTTIGGPISSGLAALRARQAAMNWSGSPNERSGKRTRQKSA